jgi:glycosyltransferase involved in cell wall biosynthesis
VRSHSVCTIVARNYTAQARVLAQSFLKHHNDATFTTLVIDGEEEDRLIEGIGNVLLTSDLGLDIPTLHRMQLIYDVMEYATALKPALLMALLRRKGRTATYLDPDIRVYAPIGDVFDLAESSGMVLTPHAVTPVPRDGRMLNESQIMHAGIYNLGFVSVGPSSYRYLAWWHERLVTDAVVDLSNALFTDQRWMDWAPALATPTVLDDRGLNVAYWNAFERPIAKAEDGTWTAGGAPLRFFHFSGYDPRRDHVLSKHQGEQPRNLLSLSPELRQVCSDYGRDLIAAGHMELRQEPYRHDVLPDGLRLTSHIRELCRYALLSDGDDSEMPDPWAEGQSFRSWLLDPYRGAGRMAFSRFEEAIWRARADLRVAMPDIEGANAMEFRNWLDLSPEVAEYYDQAGIRQVRHSLPARRRRRHPSGGWSLISYAKAELGVGEAGRRLGRAVAGTGLPWEMVGISVGTLSRLHHRVREPLVDTPEYDNSILCVNADQTPRLSQMLQLEQRPGRRIGFWFWELEDFPDKYATGFDHVDEVWVASAFNQRAIAAATDKPVHVVPLPVSVPRAPTHFSRSSLRVPDDKTVFLVNFDYLSVLERKNPLGAIEAYRRAFGPDDGACLIVKSINGHLRPLDRELVRLASLDRPDILLNEDYLSSTEMQALIELVDCLVSLHRSEGYGLNLIDAMARRTLVIATDYSGSSEFIDSTVALTVPYSLREVGPGAEPYDPFALWADPDIEAAAAAMVRVFERSSETQALVDAAEIRAFSLLLEERGC